MTAGRFTPTTTAGRRFCAHASLPCSVAAVALIAMLAAIGCNTALKMGKTPLTTTQMTADSAAFDVMSVRVPLGDPTINGELWQEIDEQHIPAEVRARLAQNGFRAGVISGQMPMALSKRLDLKDKAAESAALNSIPLADLGKPTNSECRHMPLRAGQRGEVIASAVYDQLPVLMKSDGEVCGQTYYQAQGIFAVSCTPLADGRVTLELVPEVHHDQPRQRWIGEQGIMRLDTGRPRRAFDDMKLSATLRPGEMLVLSSLPARPGSLGHHFFCENAEQPLQKVLIFRLAQTQHNDLYKPSQPLKLDTLGK